MLEPNGLIEAMQDLGINDLEDQEVNYLLKVLQKPELEGAILMPEFLQIMENFGLYDDEAMTQSQQMQMMRQMEEESGEEEQAAHREPKGKELDLSRLDEKSVKIMVMLMLFLLENNMTAQEFFDGVTYQQNVKSKDRTQTLECIRSQDFF